MYLYRILMKLPNIKVVMLIQMVAGVPHPRMSHYHIILFQNMMLVKFELVKMCRHNKISKFICADINNIIWI